MVLKRYNYCGSIIIETYCEAPIKSGLKSSSAIANAVILATLQSLKKNIEPRKILKYNVVASKYSNVTITGSFDDACASLYGNLVFTDNKKLKILAIKKIKFDVVILFKDKKKRITKKELFYSQKIAKNINKIFSDAIYKKKYEKSFILNGIYFCEALNIDPKPIFLGLKNAISVNLSGTGPSFIAIIKNKSERNH